MSLEDSNEELRGMGYLYDSRGIAVPVTERTNIRENGTVDTEGVDRYYKAQKIAARMKIIEQAQRLRRFN